MDHMGCDADIVQAARTSYQEGTKTISDDKTLIRYLLRHRHTTPFEMAEIKIHIRIPMDAWRQMVRHRTANINEYSTRYSLAINDCQATAPDEWRLQSTDNKQGSSGFLSDWPEGYDPLTKGCFVSAGGQLSAMEHQLHDQARQVYEERIRFGVAREQARKDLPLSTYTEAIWKIDLHNLLHFLGLRMDSHAQKEIRDYATVIGEKIVAVLFPITWQAFLDYRLNAMTLTALDIAVIQKVMANHFDDGQPSFVQWMAGMPEEWHVKRCRERDEFVAKITKLKLYSEDAAS
jgi:thymidylate synthase (FAD)